MHHRILVSTILCLCVSQLHSLPARFIRIYRREADNTLFADTGLPLSQVLRTDPQNTQFFFLPDDAGATINQDNFKSGALSKGNQLTSSNQNQNTYSAAEAQLTVPLTAKFIQLSEIGGSSSSSINKDYEPKISEAVSIKGEVTQARADLNDNESSQSRSTFVDTSSESRGFLSSSSSSNNGGSSSVSAYSSAGGYSDSNSNSGANGGGYSSARPLENGILCRSTTNNDGSITYDCDGDSTDLILRNKHVLWLTGGDEKDKTLHINVPNYKIQGLIQAAHKNDGSGGRTNINVNLQKPEIEYVAQQDKALEGREEEFSVNLNYDRINGRTVHFADEGADSQRFSPVQGRIELPNSSRRSN